MTVASSGDAEAASWKGLLQLGIDRCVGLQLVTPDWGERRRSELLSGDLDELLSVAELVATRLGYPDGGEYRRWLRETVGELRVQRPDVLEALKALDVPLVTTNYDGLLEEVTGWRPVTWRERARAERVLRGDERGVLHLHGYWEDPESVVLGIRSYEMVLGDAHAQAVLQGLRLTRSLLFVGFGAGLADPNFSALLRWASDVFAGSEYRQFRLARSDEVEALQREHPPEERIFVVPYGEHHDELAPFLRDLSASRGAVTEFPSTGRVWNVPHARNPAFTGREELLTELRVALIESKSVAGTRVVAVHGLGGVGKTQLVVEYGYRHASDYDVVWWIRAEDPASLGSDYALLSGELGLTETISSDQSGSIEAVGQWLEREGQSWLVVFDNADQFAALEPYLPRDGVGHVLITSLNPVWPPRVRTLAVPILHEADAIAFLLSRTGQSDEATAAVIAEELAWLPLALEQAAAYIAARGLSLTGYLERFRSEHGALLERGEPHDYSATIATTWKLAFRGATQQAPGAGDLLNLIAFFAPDMIPLEMLTAHTKALPERLRATIGGLISLDDAVTALRRYSLVEVIDDRTVSLHRLVQLVIRSQATKEDQQAWALAAVDLVTAAFPSDPEDVRTWPECERLVTHARAALRHLESLGTIYYDGSGLRNRIGLYLFHRGQLDEARVVLERGLAVAELVLDPDHPELATRLANLAAVLLGQSRLDAARALLERAVAIEEKALDPSHPQLATDLSNLGVVLMQQGDLNGARQRLERALSIHEDTLGTDQPSVAKDLNNLADVLRQLGDLDGAVELLERSLALGEAKFGTNHATVGWRLIRLAGLKRDRGDTNGARQLLARAQTVDEQVLGFAYPQVAEYLDAIAAEYRRIGELAAAQPLLERTLAIKEEFLVPLHSEVAIALNNLGTLLFELGEPANSQELLKRALAIREQVLDSSDPELADLFHNLALVTQDQGDMVSARALMERALELLKRRGDQEQTITSIMSLAMMEAADGAADSAVRRLRLLLFDLWDSGPTYNEGLSFTLLARLAEPNREARLRLLAASHAVFELIGRPEVDEAVRVLNELAESLGYNRHQVATLTSEVKQEYARDRGRALIAAAFGLEPPRSG